MATQVIDWCSADEEPAESNVHHEVRGLNVFCRPELGICQAFVAVSLVRLQLGFVTVLGDPAATQYPLFAGMYLALPHASQR